MPYLATLLLADAAQAVDNKLYVLGGGWSVTGPAPTPFALALALKVPWDEANIKHTLRLELLDADGQDRAGTGTAADEHVLRPRRAVDEVPLLQAAFLAFDQEHALAGEHEVVLLVLLAVVQARRLAWLEHADVDAELSEIHPDRVDASRRTSVPDRFRSMVPEAPLQQTEAGLVPEGDGWFVVNAREARWRTGDFGAYTRFQGDAGFAQIGVNIGVLEPGQPSCLYHREDNQEDFLVLGGECLLLIEDEERVLRAWDFVHCPPWTEHVFVGAGDGPCAILAIGARRFRARLSAFGARAPARCRRRGGDA